MSIQKIKCQPLSKNSVFPHFDGYVSIREDCNYDVSTYQYATTSQPKEKIQPKAIIYVANDNDIFKAINYAKHNDIGIAVRSGGHHYIGASSCEMNNIQLDLSGKRCSSLEEYPYHFFKYNKETNLISCGPAITLQYYARKLMEFGLFTPYGECPDVHMGGHCQTGGVSFISPSFGILADYIESITLILADNKDPDNVARKIVIPRNTTDPYLADIFYSTLGGSPGNFGVLTEVQIKPLKDSNYSDARGCLYAFPYSKQRLQRFLDLNSEYIENSLPIDYCYTVMVTSSSMCSMPEKMDNHMMYNEPDIFFSRDFNKDEIKSMKNKYRSPSSAIIVYGFWANIDKIPYKENKDAQRFFERIIEIGKPETFIERIKCNLLRRHLKKHNIGFSEIDIMPVSKMMFKWAVPIVREYPLKFLKYDILGNRTDLKTTGYARHMVNIIDDVVKSKHCKQFPQFAPTGDGFRYPPDNKTSYSWRELSTGMSGVTIFYPSKDEESLKVVDKWYKDLKECVGTENSLYATQHQCFIWAPLPQTGWNLDADWKYYFDSKEKYLRVLRTKKLTDPYDVFTANLFCVGASTCPRFMKKK